MAEVDNLVLENVRLFIDKLKKPEFLSLRLIFLAPMLTVDLINGADIDVAFDSPQIGTDRFEERIRLTKMAIAIDDRIEPLPFDLDSFVNNDPLVQKIITNGFAVVD